MASREQQLEWFKEITDKRHPFGDNFCGIELRYIVQKLALRQYEITVSHTGNEEKHNPPAASYEEAFEFIYQHYLETIQIAGKSLLGFFDNIEEYSENNTLIEERFSDMLEKSFDELD